MADGGVEVRDNTAHRRFEISVGGVVSGFAAYRLEPGRIVFVHTEIEPSAAGHGLGGALARHALDDARERGLRVTPRCPFFAGYLSRHPEYADLLDEEDRARLP